MAIKVLLVDDSALFRTRMRRLLEEQPDLAVTEARSALTGLIEIERVRPDVVLLDLHMPGDGVVMLRELRERFGALRVIVVTANATPGARRHCERLGVDAIIDKGDASHAVIPAIHRQPAGASHQALPSSKVRS